MTTLKEFINKKKEIEIKKFDNAKNGMEEGQAFAARFVIEDIKVKLNETQREVLENIVENIEPLRAAIEKGNRWGMDHYYNIITGILETYKIIFGREEYNKLTNDTGNPTDGGVDMKKLKKILEDLK